MAIYGLSMFDVEGLAEMGAMFFRVTGRWPERPALDPVLRAKARQLAEVLLAADVDEL